MDHTKYPPRALTDTGQRRKKIGTVLLAALFVAATVLVCVLAWEPLAGLVSDPEGFLGMGRRAGRLGPGGLCRADGLADHRRVPAGRAA